jgi:hypothetical protein
MAGQPQEPSWQPAGQDQTQARAAWPPPQQQSQPTFTPPGGSAQDAYGYPQQSAPGYLPPTASGYPAQEQAYPGQGQTQWQAVPGMAPGRPGQSGASGEKGFFGSLFDFSFKSFVTPKIIRVLYVLFTLWTALISLVLLVVGFRTGGMAGGLFMLIVIVPIYVLLTLGVYRVILEAFMVIFRIYEETKKISERGESHV